MKKLFLLALLILFVVVQCGQDGKDGDAFLAFDWGITPDWYWDDNDDVPATIYRLDDYEVAPGTYDFAYGITDWDDTYYEWEGTYTITINKGKKGGLITDGKDGKDKYYTLYLGASLGPDLYKPATAAPDNQAGSISKAMPSDRKHSATAIGETQVQELQKADATMRLEYRLVAKHAK